MKPLLIAHRGDTLNFPENTLEAFQSALDLGADGFELDVHLNKENEVIVVHNYLHDETKMHLLLEDVFKKFGSKARIEIEVKSLDILCIQKIKDLLGKFKPTDYEITSSILPLLQHIRKIIPDAKIGMIFKRSHFEDWMTSEFVIELLLGYMKLTNANVLHLDLVKYTPAIVNKIHKENYLLHTHLKTDSKEEYEKAVNLGIDQCTFDNINVLKKL